MTECVCMRGLKDFVTVIKSYNPFPFLTLNMTENEEKVCETLRSLKDAIMRQSSCDSTPDCACLTITEQRQRKLESHGCRSRRIQTWINDAESGPDDNQAVSNEDY